MEGQVKDSQEIKQPPQTPEAVESPSGTNANHAEKDPFKDIKSFLGSDNAENVLKVVADIILVIGIIATIVCFFALCFETEKHYYSKDETHLSFSGFITTFMVLFSTLISWSVMKVLVNISLTLKDIDKKIK